MRYAIVLKKDGSEVYNLKRFSFFTDSLYLAQRKVPLIEMDEKGKIKKQSKYIFVSEHNLQLIKLTADNGIDYYSHKELKKELRKEKEEKEMDGVLA